MKQGGFIRVVSLFFMLLAGALCTQVYAVDEGDSAREAVLASARLQVEHAKAALYEARKNLTLLMEEHGSDYPQQGFLGLFMMPASEDGVRVARTLAGAAAAKAGIRSGDLVVAINGEALLDSLGRDAVLNDTYDALANIKPGDEVRMTVQRGDRRFDTTLVAGIRKGKMYCDDEDGCRPLRHEPAVPFTGTVRADNSADPDLSMIVPTISVDPEQAATVLPFMEHTGHLARGLPRRLINGLELAELNAQLGRYFGTTHGVLVVSAVPGALPGIEQGDVIIACGDRVVTSPRQIMHMLMSYEQGDDVRLKILRDRQIADLSIQLPGIAEVRH